MSDQKPNLGFTLSDPEFWNRSDQDEAFRSLREQAPVSWHEEIASEWFPEGGRGFWSVVRHAEVTQVSKDQETFTSGFGTEIVDMTPLEQATFGGMLNMHAPQHAKYRSIVNRVLTPRTVEAMSEDIDRQAVAAINRVVEKGSADFVVDIVGDYPAQIIGDLLSVPESDRAPLIDLTVQALSAYGTQQAYTSYLEIIDYALGLIDEVRKSGHDDNFLGRLLTAEVDGESMSDQDIAIFFALLLTAGIETTASTLATGFYGLSLHPDRRVELQNNFDQLAPAAVEELIRWVSPVKHFRRTATRDVEVGGQLIREGDKVVMWYNSANRDETVFSNPDSLVFNREQNPHVGFGGGGPHFCLGAVLARKEATLFLRRLFQIVPDIQVSGDAVFAQSNFVNAVTSLPVSFTPTKKLVL
ncbi:MAG: cytochrome P450 [Actinomycetota bacterium]|nr:cytochrome P450 [Actinomycetota bacterium]